MTYTPDLSMGRVDRWPGLRDWAMVPRCAGSACACSPASGPMA